MDDEAKVTDRDDVTVELSERLTEPELGALGVDNIDDMLVELIALVPIIVIEPVVSLAETVTMEDTKRLVVDGVLDMEPLRANVHETAMSDVDVV